MRVVWEAIAVRPDPTVLRPARPAAAPAGLRPCVAADLELEAAQTFADASGEPQLRSKLRLRSVATAACAIPNGRLAVRLVDLDGATRPHEGGRGSGPPPTPATLCVRPGQLVFGDLLWSLDTRSQPAHVAIYPGGDTGDAIDAVLISVADLAVPANLRRRTQSANPRATFCWYVDRVADPGALATLTATIATPATVGAGEILRYSVTLTNPTPQPVPLSPCPDFAHVLRVKAPGNDPDAGWRGSLNCRAAPPTIGPGESVTFDFEYDTAGHPPGYAVLNWRLSTGPVPAVSVQATLTITP